MVPSLTSICQGKIMELLEKSEFHGRLVNDLCKYVPDYLLEPMFRVLLEKGVVTDTALLAYLVPNRLSLKINQARSIRNATFRQIGLNCPNLVTLDLSNCSQVGNSVVRAILQGCPFLEDIRLDRCHRITDSAFDFCESPFERLLGCLSLEAISLQGCPQITGEIITTLNKNCRRLNYLNLSQCKNVKSPKIQHIFEHNQLLSLNLSFIEDISDEAFVLMPLLGSGPTALSNSVTLTLSPSKPFSSKRTCPLQKLNLCKSKITDSSIFRMACLVALLEIRLQWCSGITDAGITSLVRNCPKLRLLDLKSCPVTDGGIASIAALCAELKELDLSWCPGFSEEGLAHLVHTGRQGRNEAQQLERLSLEWCMQVTDRTLRALSALTSLKRVRLGGCAGVTTSGVDQLKTYGIIVDS